VDVLTREHRSHSRSRGSLVGITPKRQHQPKESTMRRMLINLVGQRLVVTMKEQSRRRLAAAIALITVAAAVLALDCGYSIMVSFQFGCNDDNITHTCYGFPPAGQRNHHVTAPSRTGYRNLMLRFVRRFPRVKWISAWNEPNFRKWQPTWDKAKLAADFTYLLDRDVCSRPEIFCDIVAADLAQASSFNYLRHYRQRLMMHYNDSVQRTHYPRVWGFHPYTDIQRQRQVLANTGTAKFIRIIGKDQRVWFTEAGSRIDFSRSGDMPPSGKPYNSLERQAAAVAYLVDKLALYQGRVDRLYYYRFCGAPSNEWDSGLIGPMVKVNGHTSRTGRGRTRNCTDKSPQRRTDCLLSSS
jgi:hypothetical protein